MARIQFKRGSTQDWETANPVLLPGTPGYDTTTGALKVGDGVKAWKDIDPVGSGGIDQAAVAAAVDMALGKPLNGPLLVSTGLTAGVPGDTAEIVAFHPDNKPSSLDLQAPGGQVTVNGKSVPSLVEDVLADSPRLITPLIVGARIENPLKSVRGDLVLEAEGTGNVTVNGKRVLTVDDALNAAGGGIDQAAVEAAVAAATAPLLARIDALEAAAANNVAKTEYEALLNALVGTAQLPGNVNKVGTWAEQTRQGLAEQASLGPMLDAVLAKKADKTALQDLAETVTANGTADVTNYEFLRGHIDTLYDQKADNTRVDAVEQQMLQNQDFLVQQDADIVEYILNECATKAALAEFGGDVEMALSFAASKADFQALLDAMNGPDATVQSIQQMFWLLNDVMMALISATGIEIPGK